MKADKININALKFGIMCNFTPFCGEERARESVELIMELERLARIGRAVEKATKEGVAWIYIDSLGECTYPSIEDIESICRWMQVMESEEIEI